MDERELVILLLGLAIVVVVLRGFYVAIHARRGQVRLAIDKNIPNDVDLDALELAELPGGGARVVNRSLKQLNRQNTALDKAEAKARALDLADEDGDSHIPVLMDAAELPQTGAESRQKMDRQEINRPEDDREEFEETLDEDEYKDEIDESIPGNQQGHRLGEGWDEENDDSSSKEAIGPGPRFDLSEQEIEQGEDDPDTVLFDYQEAYAQSDEQELNPLSTVAPDYVEDTESVEGDESLDEHYFEVDTNEDDQQDYKEDAPSEENNYDESTEVDKLGSQEGQEQTFDPVTDIDEFSMTAGERIAYNAPTELFDELDEDMEPAIAKPGKSRSLFSLFGRKSSQTEQQTEPKSKTSLETEFITVEQKHAGVETDLESRVIEQQQAQQLEDFVNEADESGVALVFEEIKKPQQQDDTFEHAEVLIINVMAKQGRVFIGDDLLHSLITAGLKFGDMNIFHKRLAKENQSAVIFSVTNMLNPGTFDLNNMEEFTTLGISFFLALPTPINNLDAFDQMLDIAQDIRDTLDGEIKDDHRNGMTAQTIEHYRQRVRDFELRRLKAVAARG